MDTRELLFKYILNPIVMFFYAISKRRKRLTESKQTKLQKPAFHQKPVFTSCQLSSSHIEGSTIYKIMNVINVVLGF